MNERKWKVLLADDEKTTVEILKKKIQEHYAGSIELSVANDGQEVISKMNKEIPDILITDICMPLKSGLDVVKYIRQKKWMIKILLISGYDEFEYAREAISLGVSNYILKPFLMEEIYQNIDRMIAELDNEKQFVLNMEKLKNNTQQYRERAVQAIVDDLLEGKEILEKDRKNCEELFSLSSRFYCCGCIRLEENRLVGETKGEGSKSTLEELLNIVGEELFTSEVKLYIVRKKETLYGMIWTSNLKDEAKVRFRIKKGVEHLVNSMKKYTGMLISVSVGDVVREYRQIITSWKQALNMQTFCGEEEDRIYFFNERQKVQEKTDMSMMDDIKKSIVSATLMGNQDMAEKYLRELAVGYSKVSVDQALFFQITVGEIVYDILEELKQNLDTRTTVMEIYQKFMDEQKHGIGYPQLREFIRECCSVIEESRDTGNAKRIVETIKKYIQNNLQDEELDLHKVSEQVMFSESYVKQVFRRETGEAFKDYVIRLRLERAKELLEKSSMSVREISEMCGYKNQRYFASSFKQHHGISPTEFREKAKS